MSEITPGIGEGEQEARADDQIIAEFGGLAPEQVAFIRQVERERVLAEVEARIEDRRSPWVLGGAHRVTWNLALDAALASVRDLGGNDG